MKTIAVLIGNSDDKLSQREWSRYVLQVSDALSAHKVEIHFDGSPPGDAHWQNHCFVAEISDDALPELSSHLSELKKAYHQDSIALVHGRTSLI